jgi:hypothetical protein
MICENNKKLITLHYLLEINYLYDNVSDLVIARARITCGDSLEEKLYNFNFQINPFRVLFYGSLSHRESKLSVRQLP